MGDVKGRPYRTAFIGGNRDTLESQGIREFLLGHIQGIAMMFDGMSY